MFQKYLCGLAVVGAAAFFMTTTKTQSAAAANEAEPAAVNPLTEKWTGPYGGVPPFDKVKVADFKPALETAMAENLKEIDAIAKNPAKPDFDNTIAAFERAGKPYERATAIYRVFSSTMS